MKFDWHAAREAAYGFDALSAKIANARTEFDLVFIAEQAKSAKEIDKPRLREMYIQKRTEILARPF